ncbi:LacI family DNA-binding transcriptional regulator [Kribbella sp. NPDC005582]|uniref:LacI family DNA-binding transcriptional regulator n=1 Tax=Kribbella sp. NPDC005582 TaxID=3156893 RepID=UPI0033BAB203
MTTLDPPAEPSATDRPVVMADVAKAAGVSLQTVSRVLNAHPRVSLETRQRVQAVMRALEYRPNSTARALATGRTRSIGVVTFDATRYGPASTLSGIINAAGEAGYLLTVVPLPGTDRLSARATVDRLSRSSVDGIIAIAPQQELAHSLYGLAQQLPVVALDSSLEEYVPAVAVDEFEGARQATRHLLELGHSTVHHLAGPTGWVAARERTEGWRAAAAEAKTSVPDPLIGDWTTESGYRLGRELARDPDLTALFVANDEMALGVLRALHESGRRVPEDVSVVGFDDIPAAAYLAPPLTTLRPDFAEVGRESVSALLHQLDHDPPSWQTVRVPASLIVRHSTSSPRRPS